MTDFDVLVIGAGSGGVRAARLMSEYGARVGIVESSDFGGTCVNLGCIPKKLFSYAAHYHEDFVDSVNYGWQLDSTPDFDWTRLIKNKNQEIHRLNNVYKDILGKNRVVCLQGKARFLSAHEISVGDSVYRASKILIATGSWPWVPPIPGHQWVITSNEAFHLENLPQSIAVVGGGYIAVEFASIFCGLGCDVSLLYRGDVILRNFDRAVGEHVYSELSKKGVVIKTGARVESIEKTDSGFSVVLNKEPSIDVDKVMYATGRRPRTADLDLSSAGVELNKKGAIAVNEHYQTNVPHIYAIGDVIGKVQLTPVAIAEAKVVAKIMALDELGTLDYDNIPTAVFCHPNIGSVGLTEDEARARYDQIRVHTSTFKCLKHTLTQTDEQTFLKVIVEKASDRVVGVHMVGPDAGEIIQGIAIALKTGATKAVFDSTVGVHPTLAEEFVTMG